MHFILGFISFCLVLLYLILEWLDHVYSDDCSRAFSSDFVYQPDSAVPSLPSGESNRAHPTGGEITP